LVNTLCGHKLSIVSNVPQTTRNKIRGIYTSEEGQLVFIDTPGYYNSEKKFNLRLQGVMQEALEETDLVLYLIDVSRAPGEEEYALLEIVKQVKEKLVVALNKIDIAGRARDEITALVKKTVGECAIVETSALEGTGKERLLRVLLLAAPEGEMLYPADYYTDQEPGFRIAEIVREKVIANTREEVPHAVYVEIADMEMRENDTRLWVRGFICVERDSQKGIVIGRDGEKIRLILREAHAAISGIFPYAVELDFRVRVRPRWRRNEALLKRLIY
jgi:GTP-binding protein Era